MSRRSRRQKLKLGAAAVIAIWLIGRGFPSLIGAIGDAHWTLSDKVALLERGRAEVISQKGLEDSAQVVRDTLAAQAPRILAGTGRAEAADALVGLVNVILTRANARVTRTEPIADSTTQGLLHGARVLAAFEADVQGALGVLRELAESMPSVSVESLRLLVADPAAPTESAEVLRVELVIRGWFLEEGGG